MQICCLTSLIPESITFYQESIMYKWMFSFLTISSLLFINAEANMSNQAINTLTNDSIISINPNNELGCGCGTRNRNRKAKVHPRSYILATTTPTAPNVDTPVAPGAAIIFTDPLLPTPPVGFSLNSPTNNTIIYTGSKTHTFSISFNVTSRPDNTNLSPGNSIAVTVDGVVIANSVHNFTNVTGGLPVYLENTSQTIVSLTPGQTVELINANGIFTQFLGSNLTGADGPGTSASIMISQID